MSDLAIKAFDTEGNYTYADYLEWDLEAGERYEIIDGDAYMMAGPTVAHQRISRKLFLQFGNFLQGKPCEVFSAPLDVRLFPNSDNSDRTVVQPDLLVICDHAKIEDDRACKGAPDLVVEILSPANTTRDMFLKFQKYLKAGVREYWIVDPDKKLVYVNVLKGGEYLTTEYGPDAEIAVFVLPGCAIKLKDVWGA